MKFDRRRFLLTSAGLLAMPMFEALWPERALAQAASAPKLLFVNFPLGVQKNTWQPIGTGAGFQLPQELGQLQDFRNDIILFSGLKNWYGDVRFKSHGIHLRQAGCFLTCVEPAEGEQPMIGQSIDRLIADRLGINTMPKTIALGAAGQCRQAENHSGMYGSNISWDSSTQPASRITSPGEAFRQTFGVNPGGGTPTSDPLVTRRLALKKSLLDNSMSEISSLSSKIGTTDRQKLDQYLTGLRELERKIATIETQPRSTSQACQMPQVQGLDGATPAIFLRAMNDILVLGMSCDIIRIGSYILDYDWDSLLPARDQHSASHYRPSQDSPDYRAGVRDYLGVFTDLLGKIKNAQGATGESLLSSSIVVYGSGLHDGDVHECEDLPIIVAGRGGGLQPGKAIADKAPLANLWASIAERMGVNIDKFGDGTGKLAL